MRINGLSLMDDIDGNLRQLMSNGVQFNKLTAGRRENGGKLERLTDAFLRQKLSERYPWIDKIYTDTSDFVHLSFRHLWAAVSYADEETRTAHISISGTDPKREESAYHEICDAFFEVSKTTSILILATFMVTHKRPEVTAAFAEKLGGID